MMPDVTSALRSQRVIATLAEHDPEFRELVSELYGPTVNAETVWLDTFGKMNPGPSDVHSPGSGTSGRRAQRWALRLAAAGTAAGAVSASRDVVEGARAIKDVSRVKPAGALWPKKAAAALNAHPRRLAGTRLATGGTALAADAIASTVLHRQQKQIAKGFGSVSVEDMAKGILVQSKRVSGSLLENGPAKVARAADTAADGARVKSQARAPRANSKQPKAPAQGASPAVPAQQPEMGAATEQTGALMPGAQKPGGSKVGYYQTPAYYSKRDVEWAGKISKVDSDKQLAFGWANVCKIDGQLVTDRQGDVIVPEDLEDAAYDYVLSSRTGGDMHLRTDGTDVYPQESARPGDKPVPVAEIVESMMFTAEKKQALGLPDDFPEGWWIGMKYHDPEVWADIKAGRREGFSIHGSGMRVPIEDAA